MRGPMGRLLLLGLLRVTRLVVVKGVVRTKGQFGPVFPIAVKIRIFHNISFVKVYSASAAAIVRSHSWSRSSSHAQYSRSASASASNNSLQLACAREEMVAVGSFTIDTVYYILREKQPIHKYDR